MNPFEAQKPIPGVKNIVAVGAGKGGVGKSTVTVNLAAALIKNKLKVGILDSDIYGPSVPRMMGLSQKQPNITAQKKIVPLVNHGIKTMSMGYLVDDNSAIIWRGPMLFKAMEQLIRDVDWGDLDVLLVDLPPGTGDVQLSLVQKVPLTGAVVVSTPQDVALLDVQRCADMFMKIKIPILGLIENMSIFVCPHCEKPTELFQPGRLHAYCDEKKISILAKIPFNPQIGQGAEAGDPFVRAHDGPEEKAFFDAAQTLVTKLNL